MSTAQYKALEAHIAFWGAVILAVVNENAWSSAACFVIAGFQMIRQLYWYAQMFKDQP